MAEKRQFFDVWIIESNTVYREVPYAVVTDWVQQGRLLEEDRLRPSGTGEWLLLSGVPAIAAYLPKVEPYRTEDRAEALEPVQLDFAWQPRRGEEDDDVDMIPLIDVSLVLLIFFMMTATVASAASLINTPEAYNATLVTNNAELLWIGIDRAADGQPVYSLGQGDAPPAAEDSQLTSEEQLLEHLERRLAGNRQVEVMVRADRTFPFAMIKRMTVALEMRRPKVGRIYSGVRERAKP
jgi:biopolymer transport protein ExbD